MAAIFILTGSQAFAQTAIPNVTRTVDGGSGSVTVTGLPTNPTGDATLAIDFLGDLGVTNEFVTVAIDGPNVGSFRTAGHTHSNDCTAATQSITVPLATLAPLFADGRLLFGRTDKTTTPAGVASSNFDGERILATLGLEGRFQQGDVTLFPGIDVSYVRDEQDEYVDATATTVAAQTVVGFDDEWRGRVDLGYRFDDNDRLTAHAETFLDGIGSDTDTYGLALRVDFTF